MDLRTQKVYDALILAFAQLLEEKSFEEITVNELCERARTRRATFYKHFSDKYDFFQFMLTRLRNELFQAVESRLEDNSPIEYLHTFVDMGLEFIEKNKRLLLSVKDSNIAGQMLQTITVQEVCERPLNYLLEDELAIQFLIGGLNQCAKWWLDNMNKVPKEEIREKLYALVDKYAKAVG